jgi:hypothetical protein
VKLGSAHGPLLTTFPGNTTMVAAISEPCVPSPTDSRTQSQKKPQFNVDCDHPDVVESLWGWVACALPVNEHRNNSSNKRISTLISFTVKRIIALFELEARACAVVSFAGGSRSVLVAVVPAQTSPMILDWSPRNENVTLLVS